MSSLLLLALAMVNVPVYLLVGRRLFGHWEGFIEALRMWVNLEILRGPWGASTEEVTADIRLGILLICSAGAVLMEYGVLAQFVLDTPL